jgi:hypothetical protein
MDELVILQVESKILLKKLIPNREERKRKFAGMRGMSDWLALLVVSWSVHTSYLTRFCWSSFVLGQS